MLNDEKSTLLLLLLLLIKYYFKENKRSSLSRFLKIKKEYGLIIFPEIKIFRCCLNQSDEGIL